jgi:outer membrane receptor protein involved in Fe transport
VNENNKRPVVAATVTAANVTDSSIAAITVISDETGDFTFSLLPKGFYRITITAVGFSSISIDSIHIRSERLDFNLGDILLAAPGKNLSAVIVYAEKPLFENKDGKITFNASESALSAGASTTDLLKQTPLISVDSDGKVLMKGKEVKILIDDKPVEMDSRQLQDLLESMPGSMIEKIEVLTTPPPQYANERGGVLNIVTKKGKVGKTGRLNVNYGSRGEAGVNGSFSFRKNKLALNISSGFSYNRYRGSSYSTRENTYLDSSNFFKTTGQSFNETKRPASRVSLDYEIDKYNLFNFTGIFNSNNNEGESDTRYSNINRYDELYKLSTRSVGSEYSGRNPSGSVSYTRKGRTAGETFRVIAGGAWSKTNSLRKFFQQYLQPDGSFTGSDSTQQQRTGVTNQALSLRVNYDKPLKDKKTFLSFGATAIDNRTHNRLFTSFMKKPENVLVGSSLLSNDFEFYQEIYTAMAAIRYSFQKNFFATLGVQQEYANTSFDIVNDSNHYVNSYFSTLPFVNVTRKWEKGYSVTLSYKRSIQRPGINHLNPSVDYTDPYNTRFGNPYLQPYFSDNFDAIGGYWNKKYNLNVSVGYNTLQQIYSSIRTLQADGKTFTSWQNLSGRTEYEASLYGGVNIGKKLKVNASSAYSYNVYSLHDRKTNRYRNGGSLNSTLNGNYVWNPLVNFSSNFTYHRFANPQGRVRTSLSMNLGVQRKFFDKNLSVSLNVIDPFRQQQNKNFIQAPNYTLETYSSGNSRNYRISAAYTFKKKVKKKVPVKKIVKPK